jgi:putative ABC transport system permease protein
VVVVSQSVARTLYPGENAVGKSIRAFGSRPNEIVGVVGDVKQKSLLVGSGLQVYRSFLQQSDNDMLFVVRTTGPAADRTVPAALRRAIAGADPKVPIFSARPLQASVGASIARQQFSMTVFAVFSAVALVLAVIGIYGVMAYSVARRTGEIGVRMALGAQTSDVLRLVLVQGGRLVGVGVVAGVAGALALTRFLEKLVFATRTDDPLTYVATVLLLMVAAGTACLLPARRATKVSPMSALRAE